MAFAMMSLTMLTVTMIMETAVSPIQCHEIIDFFQAKVLGYQELVEILMIILVSSQKSLPQTFQPPVAVLDTRQM